MIKEIYSSHDSNIIVRKIVPDLVPNVQAPTEQVDISEQTSEQDQEPNLEYSEELDYLIDSNKKSDFKRKKIK